MAAAVPSSYTEKVIVSDEVGEFAPEIVELTRDEQTAQTCNAIAMLNRLAVARIRLKRANRFSVSFDREMKGIREKIHSLTDSLLLGEDVRSNLNIIDDRVTHFEQKVTA